MDCRGGSSAPFEARSARVNQRASSSSWSRSRTSVVTRVRGETQHQRCRERPGLRGVIFDLVDFDAGLLEHFARHRIFERLARLDESGDGGIASYGPTRLASQERTLAVADQHDDGRIDARELFMAARGVAAHQHMAAFRGQRLRAAECRNTDAAAARR